MLRNHRRPSSRAAAGPTPRRSAPRRLKEHGSTHPASAYGAAPHLPARPAKKPKRRRWASVQAGWAVLATLLAVAAGSGCTRTHYRLQADRQSYDAIAQKASDPRWPLRDIEVYSQPGARFFDPFSPDAEPMAPDDPTSHQLMHWVDGKHGYLRWDKNGLIPTVVQPGWVVPAPQDSQGRPELDLQAALDVARLHSRDYQANLEDVYLSALDVTFERFRFDSQYFFNDLLTQTITGPNRPGAGGQSSNVIQNTATPSVQKLYANGGQLMIDLANTIVWQVAGTDSFNASQLASFSFTQPLLRFASRARNLERLTRSERTLLANVRSMERYRQSFFVFIATGADPGQGPQRSGGVLGGAGLEGFTGVGTSGFGSIGTGANTAGNGGNAGGAGAGLAGGFLGRMQETQQIRNQRSTVAQLRQSLAQLQAAYDANRIDLFQVDQARQALFNTQSQLLTAENTFQDNLDAYKLVLGLPPQLEISLNDGFLEPFQLLSASTSDLQDRLRFFLEQLRVQPPRSAEEWALVQTALGRLEGSVRQELASLDKALQEMRSKRKEREEGLDDLRRRPEFLRSGLEPAVFDPVAVGAKAAVVERDADDLEIRLKKTLEAIDSARRLAAPPADGPRRVQLVSPLEDLLGELLEMSLIRAKAKLQALSLTPVDLTADQAIDMARYYRLDWMNARAALVDSWRLIEYNANALLSDLNVTVQGDIASTDRWFNFRGTTGQLRMGLQYDAAITRVAERNVYRQSLIDYQRARRSYIQYEDQVAQSLRNTMRKVNRDRINFELRRSAIEVAISQVDLARLRLTQPPRPEVIDPGSQQLGATTARDLISAVSDLLSVQNDFLSVYIDYQVQRMVLDRDIGMLQLDDRGMWIDPGRFIYSLPPGMTGCPAPFALPPPVDGLLDGAGLRLEEGGEEVPAGATPGSAPVVEPLPAQPAVGAPVGVEFLDPPKGGTMLPPPGAPVPPPAPLSPVAPAPPLPVPRVPLPPSPIPESAAPLPPPLPTPTGPLPAPAAPPTPSVPAPAVPTPQPAPPAPPAAIPSGAAPPVPSVAIPPAAAGVGMP